MEEEYRGFHTGRIQAGKSHVCHGKELVHYPAGHGESLKGFQHGKNIGYSDIISDCVMEC